jgi:hypothetical protein
MCAPKRPGGPPPPRPARGSNGGRAEGGGGGAEAGVGWGGGGGGYCFARLVPSGRARGLFLITIAPSKLYFPKIDVREIEHTSSLREHARWG